MSSRLEKLGRAFPECTEPRERTQQKEDGAGGRDDGAGGREDGAGGREEGENLEEEEGTYENWSPSLNSGFREFGNEHSSSKLRVIWTNVQRVDSYFLHLTMHN